MMDIAALIFVLYSMIIKPSLSAEIPVPWDYDNIEEWAEIEGFELCDAIDESPIDVVTDEVVVDTDKCGFDWDIDYEHNTFEIKNNGHTIVVV